MTEILYSPLLEIFTEIVAPSIDRTDTHFAQNHNMSQFGTHFLAWVQWLSAAAFVLNAADQFSVLPLDAPGGI